MTKVDKNAGVLLPKAKEEEKKDELNQDEEGEGSNLGDPVSDQGALSTIEDF